MQKRTLSFGRHLCEVASNFLSSFLSLSAALMLLLASPAAVSANFVIDTSSTSMTGLWGNQNESGWGTAITHEYEMIFVTIYTYDASGNPVWYVASSCPVAADKCAGTLYSVKGGTSLTEPWNGTHKVVAEAGTLNLVFTDANTGTMTYTVNGVSGSKEITRQVFANGATQPSADYSGLWGNASESGWGVALTRQFDMTFVTIYTYDANGNPKWYVASSCPMVADGCSGPLYSVTGGSPLTTAWNGTNKVVAGIGNMNLAFTDPNTGTMTFTINGMSDSKAITRQIFANPPVIPPVSGSSACSSTTAPAGMNYSQSGNTLSISTTGCIPVPTAGVCNPSTPQATGINVLTTATLSSFSMTGITFNMPGITDPFSGLGSAFAATKQCIVNAPAERSDLNVNFNVCYDITSEMASSVSAMQSAGMIAVTNPVTAKAQGAIMMQTVSDCATSGADTITDAFTGKVSVKQPNGSYLQLN